MHPNDIDTDEKPTVYCMDAWLRACILHNRNSPNVLALVELVDVATAPAERNT